MTARLDAVKSSSSVNSAASRSTPSGGARGSTNPPETREVSSLKSRTLAIARRSTAAPATGSTATSSSASCRPTPIAVCARANNRAASNRRASDASPSASCTAAIEAASVPSASETGKRIIASPKFTPSVEGSFEIPDAPKMATSSGWISAIESDTSRGATVRRSVVRFQLSRSVRNWPEIAASSAAAVADLSGIAAMAAEIAASREAETGRPPGTNRTNLREWTDVCTRLRRRSSSSANTACVRER